MTDQEADFPRGTKLPRQTPLFWVADKDRYIRQLALRDLEQRFKRRQLVYFTRCDSNAQIDIDDDRLLLELLNGCGSEPIDLHLETNGGYTDAAEKLLSILEPYRPNLRVIVGRRAKSNGTLLALAGASIVMGVGSELGPIDPFINLGPQQSVPAQFILQSQNIDPVIVQIAQYAMTQTQQLATSLLQTGQLASNQAAVQSIVSALSTRSTYPSHGSVIDAGEAQRLGLNVERWSADSDDWRWVWLLRCLYEQDARRNGLVKIFEGPVISNAIQAGQPT
jgi:hypothetical protein